MPLAQAMPGFLIPTIVLISMIVVFICLIVAVVKKCYLVVRVDQAVVKTGFGPAEARTGCGILVFPIVNHIEIISLVWQPIEFRFDNQPLRCEDNETTRVAVTVWISVDNTEEAILDAAQNFGAQAGEAGQIEKLYHDSIRQVIETIAQNQSAASYVEHAPEISRELYLGIEGVLDGGHVLQRATLQLLDSATD